MRHCSSAFVLAVLLTAASAALARDDAQRPNILLLVAEDLSARIGAFGDPVAQTPNLDRLAAEGVRYPNTFATAGVCAPARAALITGVHQIAIGAQHMRTSSRPAGGYRAVPPPGVKAFPEHLRAAGYYTFTSWKLDYQFSGPRTGSGPFTIWDAEDDELLWDGRDPQQPFFGMLNFIETHESGVFTPLGHWPHSGVHLGAQLLRAWAFGRPDLEGGVQPEDLALPPYYPDTPTVRTDLARHYANIRQMDRAVGEVLARLERDGLADSTIVVWVTDHGDGLPRAKRELFDSGMRVPMIVRWPETLRPADVVAGGEDRQLVSFVDFAPTLLALAGAERPPGMVGRDFLSRATAPRRYVYGSADRVDEVEDRQRAVRDDRYKYIRSWAPTKPRAQPIAFRDNIEMMRELWALLEARQLDAVQRQWFEAPGEERLFDTRVDPHEVRDLSRDPAHAEVLARMRDALAAWRQRVPDWSEESEDAMVARFQPDGVPPVTRKPSLRLERGRAIVEAASLGSSLGVRIDEGPWRLYTGPVEVPKGAMVSAKAVRYGWEESEITSLVNLQL